MRNFFKRKPKENEKRPFVFTTNNLRMPTGNGDRIRTEGGSRSGFAGTRGEDFQTIDSLIQVGQGSWVGGNLADMNNASPKTTQVPTDDRKYVEPKEVFDQIKRESPEIDFQNLDVKIEGVEERLKILSEHLDESHLADEHRALFYLKNRRKYMDTRKKYPIDWAMTTQEAVDHLCKSYKLRVVPLKQFYTLVPKDGLKEMDRYTKAYKAITGDNPIFELVVKDTTTAPIAAPEAKAQKRKDRDPILLANSPLGNHLFILGVWDEEVEIVDEIIYYGK